MNGDDFKLVIELAIKELPDEFKDSLDNIAIIIEDEPRREVLNSLGIRKGTTLLGLYQGVPLPKRTHYYGNVLPDQIIIYKNSIEKISRTKEDAIENIKKTLLHEVGHYFGITEKRLRELGY